jgi:hypothetical protein
MNNSFSVGFEDIMIDEQVEELRQKQLKQIK